MKEGYYQSKAADFSEKIQNFEHRLKMAETEYERFQMQLGQFKQLLKKLRNIEEFQEEGIKRIITDNESVISGKLDQITQITEKKMERIVYKKTKLLEDSLQQIKEDEAQLQRALQQIDGFHTEISYYKEFQKLLMLKLINKGILNHRELQEVELRAKKRVKSKE